MAFKVKFSPTTSDFTIKSSAAATKVGALSDVDQTSADAKVDGATLVYDAQTQTYKSKKIYEENADGTYTLKGGSF